LQRSYHQISPWARLDGLGISGGPFLSLAWRQTGVLELGGLLAELKGGKRKC
jgi:hypothetical protein